MKIQLLTSAALALACAAAQACTIWTATGAGVTENGETIAVKVRDFTPSKQQLLTVRDGNGYAFRGIVSGQGRYRMGINEKRLFVANSMESSFPKAFLSEHYAYKSPEGYDILETLARRCASVDEALAMIPRLGHKRPINIILADPHSSAIAEVLPDGTLSVKSTRRGTLCHTNHYVYEDTLGKDKKPSESSLHRYARISKLLKEAARPLTLTACIGFTKDQAEGPHNSIFRTGTPDKKSRTLSVLAVRIPASGPIEFYSRYQADPRNPADPWLEQREQVTFP